MTVIMKIDLVGPKSRGLAYNDPNHASGQVAAKTHISTFVCPSTPISPKDRDPVHGYGVWDYMIPASTDVDGSALDTTADGITV